MGFGMNKKIDSLQALRFIACLCIFLHHCYLIKMVYWGVSLFIVLSGFLMCLSYYDRYDAPLSPLVSLRFSLGKIRKLYLLNVLTMLPVLALDYIHDALSPDLHAGICRHGDGSQSAGRAVMVPGLCFLAQRRGMVPVRVDVFLFCIPVYSPRHKGLPPQLRSVLRDSRPVRAGDTARLCRRASRAGAPWRRQFRLRYMVRLHFPGLPLS